MYRVSKYDVYGDSLGRNLSRRSGMKSEALLQKSIIGIFEFASLTNDLDRLVGLVVSMSDY